MNDSLEDYIHFISDAPQAQNKPSTTKESLLLTLQKKKECAVRAMKTLEFLIEGKIRPEVFVRCINHLDRSYYSDIIEERSLTKLCGYCLCDNNIPEISKQQYAIDSKNNKVYDVTNRKKYCSDYCYKASIHVEKQIDDSPLWLRNPKDYPKYTLLPTSDRGIPGDDLGSDLMAQKDTIPFESAYSFTDASLQELTEQKAPDKMKETLKPDISVKENIEVEKIKPKQDSVKQTNHNKVKNDHKLKKKHRIQLLRQYILEWLTLETYVFLFGEARFKDALAELDLSNTSSVTTAQQKELIELCKRLDLADNKIGRILNNPGPSYQQIKKENKEVNVKVKSFYSAGSYEVEEPKTADNDVFPTPGSPNVIRQNVFLSSVTNAMKLLTENVGVPWEIVLKDLEELVKTFTLQPYSVVFQPVEWNLISLILIKMLSLHNSVIREHLSTPKSETFINTSVSAFPGIQTMLTQVLLDVEDINSFLNRYFSV